MSSSTSDEHHRLAAERGPVSVAIITVSDSRTAETDVNGAYLREAIASAGHRVASYHVVPDSPSLVAMALDEVAAAGEARIVLLNGGTGIASRDNTFDVVKARLEKEIPGFGELFRMLSFEQVGAAAMLSRAVAGVAGSAILISVPGSPAAVRLAWERLIAPELEHLAWELWR
ncbi:MAG: MogA/MoaB family molybdenum cofactor biosynthesis protein [Gemmatimonadetes bacterium]|nr:MogA/MoaB family molybdenum cofactor biosynthesis protein [Gemmatimonadota bacterium]